MSQTDIDRLKQRILPCCPTEVTDYIQYLESTLEEHGKLSRQLLTKLKGIEVKVEQIMNKG